MARPSGQLSPPSDDVTGTVSVLRVDSAPGPLVYVRVALGDGQVRTIVIDSKRATVGAVTFSALALAQLALQRPTGS